MGQTNYSIPNQNGAAFRANLNILHTAIQTNNSGPVAPTDTEAYMFWADTSSGILKQRNSANTAWISLFSFGSSLLSATNNLSDLENKADAFTEIKQPASTTTTGVVEKATPTEMTSGTTDKYPDAALVKSFVTTTVDAAYAAVKLPISGLVVTNNVTDLEHDVDISAGSVDGEVLATGITKSLDAPFAEGDGGGGMIGTLPTSGVVYIFLIKKDADGSLDVYAETTDGTSTPSGWTIIKRIAVRITDASANLQRVKVYGDGEKLTIYPASRTLDYTVTSISTTRTLHPISGVLNCPPNVVAEISMIARSSNAGYILATSVDEQDVTPTANLCDMYPANGNTTGSYTRSIWIGASRQYYLRRMDGDIAISFSGGTISWIEDRS